VVLPNANVAVTITATTSTTRTFDVAMTPAPGQAGSSVVTLTASDGSLTAVTTFSLTVTIPQPPTIAPIAAQATPEDTPRDIAFTLSDADTPLDTLVVTATSSNTTLVANANLAVAGSGTNRTLTATPAANQSGTTTITIVVNDGVTSAQTSFVLTVSVDDPPIFAACVPR
jgi:hypothetical protein